MSLPKTTFRFMWHFIQQQRWGFIAMLLISVLWAVNDTFFPFFLKLIVNTLQNYQGNRELVYAAVMNVVILLVAFWGITEFLLRIQGIIALYLFPTFRANIRHTVFEYVRKHSHEYFSNHFAGDLSKKLGDLPSSSQVMMESICFNFITALVGSAIVLVMMWLTMPLFAVILFTWLCLHLSITFIFLRRANTAWESHSQSVSALSGKIVDAFTNILNVRLFARGAYEKSYLEKFQQEEIVKAKKATWIIEKMRIYLGLSGLFLIFSMVLLLIHGWVKHWVTLGDFTQVAMQTFWLLGWIWHVSYQLTVFVRESGTVGDALNLVTKAHDVLDPHDSTVLKVTNGEIQFDKVTFAYQRKHTVFADFNVTIPAGQRVGLVGFSGSGKSTFVNLILRFYDVQAGKILIDHQDIAHVTQDSLRAHIAMIPQEPMLFHRSLMENIRYGRIDATDEEVIAAAKLAHCDEFIQQVDGGYKALVGERGVKLSGGQRQRIAIARAILKDAPILILDEATAALDSVTEKLIQESLHKLMQGRTTIVIAHRLSTLGDMDRIIVFHHGKIAEDDTKENLLKTGGRFQMLWNMQMDGFLPEEAEGVKS